MKTVAVERLKPHPNQIRKEFDRNFLKKLSASIQRFGVVVPILALKDGTIVAGEQRWRAARMAGRRTLQVGKEIIFLEGDLTRSPKGRRQDIDVINAIENIVRKNLNVFEESEGLIRLAREYVGIQHPSQLKTIAIHAQVGNRVEKWRREIDQLRELIKSTRITPTRAVMLIHLQDIEPRTRNYVLKRAGTSRYKFNITRLYELSKIPKKHQMMMARAVAKRAFSAVGIRVAYEQWKKGLRDDDMKLKYRRDAAEMERHNKWYERREALIANLKQTTRDEKFFSWPAFQLDVNLMINDGRLARQYIEQNKTFPRNLDMKISALIGILRELEEKMITADAEGKGVSE